MEIKLCVSTIVTCKGLDVFAICLIGGRDNKDYTLNYTN